MKLHEIKTILDDNEVKNHYSDETQRLYLSDNKFTIYLTIDDNDNLFIRTFKRWNEQDPQYKQEAKDKNASKGAKYMALKKMHSINETYADGLMKLEALPESAEDIILYQGGKSSKKSILDIQ